MAVILCLAVKEYHGFLRNLPIFPFFLSSNGTLGLLCPFEFFLPPNKAISDVISTVGPQGEYPKVLAAAYSNCLALMLANNLRSTVREQLAPHALLSITVLLYKFFLERALCSLFRIRDPDPIYNLITGLDPDKICTLIQGPRKRG